MDKIRGKYKDIPVEHESEDYNGIAHDHEDESLTLESLQKAFDLLDKIPKPFNGADTLYCSPRNYEILHNIHGITIECSSVLPDNIIVATKHVWIGIEVTQIIHFIPSA